MNIIYFLIISNLLYFSKERLIIDSPNQLSQQFNEKEIPIFFTNYGRASLGFKIRGKLYTLNKTSKIKNYSCSPLPEINIISKPDGSFLYPILIISKGECSYHDMAINIQKSGAYMGIIINDNNDINNIIIDDDEESKGIFIQIIIIGKNNGEKIMKFIEDNEKEDIIIDVEYSMIKSNVVNIEFFMQFGDEEIYFLLHEFKKYYKKFKKNNSKLNVSTIFITNELSDLNEKEKEKNCISKGKYCLNGNLPKNKLIEGKKLILESLFHQCISSELGSEFFSFADYFYEECLYEKKFKKFCGKKKISSMKKVNNCIYNSFNANDNSIDIEKYFNNENKILENNRLIQKKNNIKSLPTIIINGIIYNDELNANNLFNIICSGFNYKNSACKIKKQENKDNITLFDIIIIVVVVLILNCLIYILCKKYVVKRLKNKLIEEPAKLGGKVNTVVSSYFNLNELDSKTIEPNIIDNSIINN